MKFRTVAVLLLTTLLLGGCGSLAGRHNIDSGFSYIESHEYQSALGSFDAAEQNGEDMTLIHRGRGIAYLSSGEYEKAAEELMASLASDNGLVDDMDFDTNYYLADAFIKLGEFSKAREVYDAIISLRDKDSTAYYLRGTAELSSGDHDAGYSTIILIYKSLAENGYEEEGLSILQRAMENGSDFMTNFEKGQISFYLGNNADAQSYLEAARNERNQEKEPVVIMLGQTGEKQGDYNFAISVYKTYLNENPNSAVVYNQLGMCQIRQGDYQGAVTSFETGLTLEDKSLYQALMLNEITAYEYMGEFGVAKALMDTYLSTYPEDEKGVRENIFLSTR